MVTGEWSFPVLISPPSLLLYFSVPCPSDRVALVLSPPQQWMLAGPHSYLNQCTQRLGPFALLLCKLSLQVNLCCYRNTIPDTWIVLARKKEKPTCIPLKFLRADHALGEDLLQQCLWLVYLCHWNPYRNHSTGCSPPEPIFSPTNCLSFPCFRLTVGSENWTLLLDI